MPYPTPFTRHVPRFLAPAAASLCLVAVLAGCHSRTQNVGGAPATPARLEELRAAYTMQRPGTVVGAVIAVLPEQSLLAVGDVPVDRFAEGDMVSIIDSKENTLAIAQVVRRLPDSVHVRYQSRENARAPLEGDIVVRLPLGSN
jgi:hypothetical protein